MGITAAVTRVAANTSTGNQSITTTDLGGLTPKAVALYVTRAVTDGTTTDGAGFYWGLSDGTNEATGAYESQHAQASMDAVSNRDTTANRILTIYDGTADNVVEATADFVAFIANGVTIDWTDAPAGAYLIVAVFFAGTDLSAKVGLHDLGSTADALLAFTDVGFEADVVLTFLSEVLDPGNLGMGLVHNNRAGTVTQRSVAHSQRGSFGTSQVGAQMRDGEGIARLINSSQAIDYYGTFQSFDSSGWDVQLGNARAPSSDCAYLALRFGASPVVSSKVYTYSTATVTGSHTDSGPGFEPQFVMYLSSPVDLANSSMTDARGGSVGVLVADANEVYHNTIHDEDAAADSNTSSMSDNRLAQPAHTGTPLLEASFTSLGATGPVWNYVDASGVVRLWPALAIEVFSAGGAFTQGAAGTVTSAGALNRKTGKGLAGATTPAGAVIALRRAYAALAGSLSPAGAVTALRTAYAALVGALSPAGELGRATRIAVAGALSSAGAVAALRRAYAALAGTLSPAGSLGRATKRAVAGALSFAGSLSSLFSGGGGEFTKALDGALTAAGLLNRSVAMTLAGAVTSAGALGRKAALALAGALSPAGALSALRTAYAALAGTLAPSGALGRRTAVSLNGAVAVAGALGRGVRRAVGGVLSLAGALAAEALGLATPVTALTSRVRTLALTARARVFSLTSRDRD